MGATLQIPTVRSANRVLIKVAGQSLSPDGSIAGAIGLAQDLRIADDLNLQDVSGIGDARVIEWVPGQYRVQATCRLMVFRTKSLEQHNLAPPGTADYKNEPWEFDLVVTDENGNELKKIVGCVYANGSVTITRHAIIVRDVTFFGKDTVGDWT